MRAWSIRWLVPLVAQSIDIETARFDGNISNPTSTGFTYTRNFKTATDDYSLSLNYISSRTGNGSDANGNAISGFKWWNFTFPTVLDSGSNAIPDFISATGGAVNFGSSAGTFGAWGDSYAIWNDPANPNGWAAAVGRSHTRTGTARDRSGWVFKRRLHHDGSGRSERSYQRRSTQLPVPPHWSIRLIGPITSLRSALWTLRPRRDKTR